MESEKSEKSEESEESLSITFERPEVSQGTTYFDTATLIQQLDTRDPEWLAKTTALIKRFVHYEKLSLYSRIFIYTEKGTCAPDFFESFLKDKKKTHRMLYDVMSKEISEWSIEDNT